LPLKNAGEGMTRSSDSGSRKRRWIVVGAAIILGVVAAGLGAASLVVYSGAIDVAGDTPHSSPVYWLMQKVRQHSVAARARDAVPNDLGDPKRVASGAGQYAEMCSGCHLAPGMQRTEISRGLYPRAPELRRGSALTPVQEFWVVKHGIKMTGMPAWGVTHDDELLWDVVAFLRKLPDLTAEEYQALVKNAPSHDDMMRQMEMDNPRGNGHQPHP
jgi:mono/diheme cytochrome c family protein